MFQPVGGGPVVSALRAGQDGRPVSLPCGGCIGCRIDRQRAWAIRCMHEASQHDSSCFVTATYADAHLPDDYSLSVRDLQLFFKRLRKMVGSRIRYFCGGEYGPTSRRPHYHMVIFGYYPADAKYYSISKGGMPLYISADLTDCWGMGYVTVGAVSPQSAGYCAGYSLKKITGDAAHQHYRVVHPITGELVNQRPEFALMSRRPGIGATWWDRFGEESISDDSVIVDGRPMPVPRYYVKRSAAQAEASGDDTLLAERQLRSAERALSGKLKADSTPARLETRATSARIRASRFERTDL